jgi:trimethylamine--corrinoid protein Co-methyltransferase
MTVSLLTELQIAQIHEASLQILERVGVLIPHPEVLSRLADQGAAVDPKKGHVRLPPDMVERLVSGAGKQFATYGRDLSRKAEFGAGRRNYNTIAGEAYWVDDPGGARRYASLSDVATAARAADGLEHITIAGAMSDPHELPVAWRCVAVAAQMVESTVKPITFWYHDRASARFLSELMVAVRGDEEAARRYPLFHPFLEPISPLRFPFNGVDLLFETARLDLPVPVGPMAQMGMSAPVTLAGTMAQENAEILAGICITQAVKPGLSVCYGGICHAFDMRTTQLVFGGPEQALFGVAMTQMGKSYGLPVYINVGLTDSKRPDAQAGLECGVTLALGAAAGADIFGHMGIIGVDQASSVDMLVFQHEVIRYVESVNRPVDCSDEAMAVNLIEQVGPGGAFIQHPHTAENFRRELWFPQLLDRAYYDQWREEGSRDTEQRCRRQRQEILEKHEVPPLPSELERELAQIVESARRNLGG